MYSHSDISVFLEVMKHQHAPGTPVYIMTLISSIFALTSLGDVRVVPGMTMTETVLFSNSIYIHVLFFHPRHHHAFKPALAKLRLRQLPDL